MKKKITTLLVAAISAMNILLADAQETARERLAAKKETTTNQATLPPNVRVEQMNRGRGNDPAEAKWMRTIYRYIDLSEPANAPLYYPAVPEEGRMNLFTLIFKLMADNRVAAYEYLDGREVFTEEYRIDFQEFLDRFGIYYRDNPVDITVSDIDIPSNEVVGYYIKEVYFFETGTSNFGVHTAAICPVMQRQDDFEANSVRYPLFWIDYHDIRSYTMRMPVMASERNNAANGTIDDFFRNRKYEGEIYKAGNPANRAISQYTATEEERKREQERIEQELKAFERMLWTDHSDSTRRETGENAQRPARKSRKAPPSASNSMRDRRY